MNSIVANSCDYARSMTAEGERVIYSHISVYSCAHPDEFCSTPACLARSALLWFTPAYSGVINISRFRVAETFPRRQ